MILITVMIYMRIYRSVQPTQYMIFENMYDHLLQYPSRVIHAWSHIFFLCMGIYIVICYATLRNLGFSLRSAGRCKDAAETWRAALNQAARHKVEQCWTWWFQFCTLKSFRFVLWVFFRNEIPYNLDEYNIFLDLPRMCLVGYIKFLHAKGLF